MKKKNDIGPGYLHLKKIQKYNIRQTKRKVDGYPQKG
jgi:hypothetical protein